MINGKVAIINRTISNILNNYIPHEIIVLNDIDPPWFNDKLGYLLKKKRQDANIFVKMVTMLINKIV